MLRDTKVTKNGIFLEVYLCVYDCVYINREIFKIKICVFVVLLLFCSNATCLYCC